MTSRCPYCKTKESSADKSLWPFCSERCKTSDLGRWIKEDYRISQSSIGDSSENQAPTKDESNE